MDYLHPITPIRTSSFRTSTSTSATAPTTETTPSAQVVPSCGQTTPKAASVTSLLKLALITTSKGGSRYGKQAWCNLEGRYIHIVANLTHLSGPYEMTICTFAVFGTQYVRNTTVPTSVEIAAGDTKILEVEPIYAK